MFLGSNSCCPQLKRGDAYYTTINLWLKPKTNKIQGGACMSLLCFVVIVIVYALYMLEFPQDPSVLAQRKSVGPITQRPQDRNLYSLFFLFAAIDELP